MGIRGDGVSINFFHFSGNIAVSRSRLPPVDERSHGAEERREGRGQDRAGLPWLPALFFAGTQRPLVPRSKNLCLSLQSYI